MAHDLSQTSINQLPQLPTTNPSHIKSTWTKSRRRWAWAATRSSGTRRSEYHLPRSTNLRCVLIFVCNRKQQRRERRKANKAAGKDVSSSDSSSSEDEAGNKYSEAQRQERKKNHAARREQRAKAGGSHH